MINDVLRDFLEQFIYVYCKSRFMLTVMCHGLVVIDGSAYIV